MRKKGNSRWWSRTAKGDGSMKNLGFSLRACLTIAAFTLGAALVPITGTEIAPIQAAEAGSGTCFEQAGDDCSSSCKRECSDGSCCEWLHKNYL